MHMNKNTKAILINIFSMNWVPAAFACPQFPVAREYLSPLVIVFALIANKIYILPIVDTLVYLPKCSILSCRSIKYKKYNQFSKDAFK